MKKLLTAACALSLLTAPLAFGRTTTKNIHVSAKVIAACTVTTAPLNFGTYDATSGAPTDATSTVSLTCTKNHNIKISLDQGSSTAGTRTLVASAGGNTDVLTYDVFSDAGHTLQWGDGTTGGAAVTTDTDDAAWTNAAASYSATFTLYGEMAAHQAATPDTYSDTLHVSIDY